MGNGLGTFGLDDWDEDEEDEVLYESDDYLDQFDVELEEPPDVLADDLPVLPLRGVVVYPMMWLPLPVGQARSLRLVEDNLPENRIIALVSSVDEEIDEPGPEEINRVGTAAQVHRVLKTPDGTVRLLVQGLERIRITEYV